MTQCRRLISISLSDAFINFPKKQEKKVTSLFKYNLVNSSPFLKLNNLKILFVLPIFSTLVQAFFNLLKKSRFFNLLTGFS